MSRTTPLAVARSTAAQIPLKHQTHQTTRRQMQIKATRRRARLDQLTTVITIALTIPQTLLHNLSAVLQFLVESLVTLSFFTSFRLTFLDDFSLNIIILY